MNVQAAYSHWSTSYDSVANPTRDLDQQVMRRLLDGKRFGHVLELGCGTGKNTPWLAALFMIARPHPSSGLLAQKNKKPLLKMKS